MTAILAAGTSLIIPILVLAGLLVVILVLVVSVYQCPRATRR